MKLPMPFVSGSVLLLTLFVALLGGTTWCHRRWGWTLESCRRATHVGMGFACLSFPLFVSSGWQILALAAVFCGLLALLRSRPGWFGGGAGLFPASRSHSEGEFYFVGGVAAAFLVSGPDRPAYSAAILLLTVADPAAALVGRRFGRCRCWGNAKTLEGSAAFLAVAGLSLHFPTFGMPVGGDVLWMGLVCLLVTAAEGVSGRGSDNLWIPLVCASGIRLHGFDAGYAPRVGILAVAVLMICGIAAARVSWRTSAERACRRIRQRTDQHVFDA